MILCIENPKDTMQKLWELINKHRKVASIQDQHTEVSCTSYTKNEISERESQRTILFKIASKNKILRYKSDQGGERIISWEL